ncbi:MAG: potassium channel family protein [Alphaproteobacteria bacterium]|jgi:uncharacterized membrane protein|nr:potassium channel family protein [Alphaproteobacteria bacterium]MEA2976112.1 potassium channel family protein [Alphaproteobacteria bacterium]
MAPKTGKKSETSEGGGERHQPGTGRIEAFSDGVIAIIITIMVLNLKLPDGAAERGLWQGVIVPLAPILVSYVMSFVVVGVMWVNHHQLMPTAPVATRPLMWWNNNLLFWMSLIPFVTNFLGQNPFLPLAFALYGFVLCACSIGFLLLRVHIAAVTKNVAVLDAHHNRVLRKTIIGSALYAASVPLAFLSVYMSLAIFLIVPAMFFLPEVLPKKLPEALDS